MNLFLLKLIAELLEGDKPTVEEIGCAKKILDEMINGSKREIEKIDKESLVFFEGDELLDDDAKKARKELLG